MILSVTNQHRTRYTGNSRMRLPALLLTVLLSVQLPAQQNSDRREIARKKIRTATATEVTGSGDSLFHRYTYDEKGRLIKTEDWQRGVSTTTRTFSVSGRMISELEIHFGEREDSLVYVNGATSFYTDTMSLHRTRCSEATGEQTYELDVTFERGKPFDGWLLECRGDTTFYYRIKEGKYALQCFFIRSKVDSLTRGYSESFYDLKPGNTNNKNGNADTVVSCSVIVLDRRNDHIRRYDLQCPERDSEYVRKSDGTLYTPATDSLAYSVLRLTYTYRYRSDGTLRYWTQTDQITKESTRFDIPSPGDSCKPYRSLATLQNSGPVTFEYYQ